jgi:hypothetical protein
MHSGRYALQESVRRGVDGMFAASGTIIMSNEPP